ncbi:hypothetical protein TASIC1_0014019400 [Trichoderma asperellum]|uniref:Uncharacterized protein n=1 Tax=Trichoderma asperellum TaxID=101201 RepID=A0A6V8R678_TRIAP|nr:hypothetical protein TASIC1_0014019400 [Trichoderma asperellum]
MGWLPCGGRAASQMLSPLACQTHVDSPDGLREDALTTCATHMWPQIEHLPWLTVLSAASSDLCLAARTRAASMESAVRQEPASPGLAPLGDSLRTGNMDDPADSSSVTFAAAASSHEDEDLKESDGWKLHSDTEGQSGVEEEDVAQAGEQVDLSQGVPTKLPDPIHRARQTSLGMGLSDLRYSALALPKHRCHCHRHLFESRLEKMQQLRDDYQVLESSYEALEAMLDEEERDLSILETRFFSILAAGQTKEERQLDISSDSGAANFSIDQTEIPYELRGISPYGPVEEPHPLYMELTSTVGYLGNARDEYADLLSTKQQYEEEQQLKKTTKQKVSDEQEMKEFFDEFPYEEQRMNDIMTSLESKVNGLKKLCEDRGVMKKHMSIKMEYALDPQIRYEDLDLDDEHTIMSRRKTLAHTEFNELLSQPDHVLAEEPLTTLGALKAAIRLPNHHPEKGVKKRLASKEYAIDNLMRECDGGKKADYVNRWLLHQLRLSPLNAVLLRSTFQASRSLKIRDMWRWQCDVMHYWWRDSTMSLVDGFFKPITSDNSEYSSRVGTTQLSRAASDGVPRHIYQRHPSVDNSDAMTEHG